MEARAYLKYARIAPRKVQIVLDLIRNKPTKLALAILKHTPKAACEPVEKLLKAEYLLPIYIDELLQNGKVSVKVLDSHDKWFGVTYKEDKQAVIDSLRALIASGAYPEKLYQ